MSVILNLGCHGWYPSGSFDLYNNSTSKGSSIFNINFGCYYSYILFNDWWEKTK